MNVVHLNAGAGGMYCGSCLHGNTLSAALRQAGAEVTAVPLYTPLRLDEPGGEFAPVAFGGINVFLQQHSALFRHAPAFVDHLLDRPALLRRAARYSGSTRPQSLGPLFVSMLHGEEGRQRKEIRKLLAWLKTQPRPDVVHLANGLLVGIARPMARELGVPVVATLAGEDLFVEQIPEPYRSQARTALRERVADLAGLTALNGYFADFMADYLAVPRAKIAVIRPGLNLAGHAAAPQSEPGLRRPPEFTIGYLARVAPEKGLHLAAESLAILAADQQLPPLRLAAAGSLSAIDRPYFQAIQQRLVEQGLANRFEYIGEPDRAGKIAFLQGIDVLVMPTVYPESRGLPVLEAWANGVAVVAPEHGTFPEWIADTGGGLLHRPADPAALATAIRQLIADPQGRHMHGVRGHQAVHARYHAGRMAQETLAWYRSCQAD
jgi:glycosyltransferase involved in cell wall biosynthesis